MSDKLLVRKAKITDAAQIAKVHVETWQHAYKGQISDDYLDGLSTERKTERWNEILSKPDPGAGTYIAVISNKIIGFCSVGPCRDEDMDSSTGELLAIYVLPEYMRKGAGSALQEYGLNFLHEQGYMQATLWVLRTNEKTINWYKSKGWRLEGKTKTEDRKGFVLDEVRYIIKIPIG